MTETSQTYHFKLKNLREVHDQSHRLARYFPRPEQFITGIYELLLNAIEHGNLGIGFEAKSQLLQLGKWRDEVDRRLALPQYADKTVDIRLTRDAYECRLTIADQGDGFPWQHYLTTPANDRLPNGRGLLIAFNSQFDEIRFSPAGNEVTCIVKY